MRLRQRFYLVEVLVGLGVTAAHFFANLGRHTARHVFGSKTEIGRAHV